MSETTQTISSAKRQKLGKHYKRNHQTYIDITLLGNAHGFHKDNCFLKNLRAIIFVLVSLEPRLVVLSYPHCHTTTKRRPFQNEASVISSLTCIHMYLGKLWLRDGAETSVKKFVAHNALHVAFNSLEFRACLEAL